LRRLASRAERIRPFIVMDILERARRLEAQGRKIIHMEIGEPDFPTPAPIVAAGMRALAGGALHYTPAPGLESLRRAIAAHYLHRYGVALNHERIFVTPGASGAFLLVLGLVLESGDQVLVPDPGYPCNRNLVRLFGGEPVLIPVDAAGDYHLTPELVRAHWTPATAGVWITSPANPTGTVIDPRVLGAICREIEASGGFLLSDEIYHGLEYGRRCVSALELCDDAFVVNSFSKYFGMTGWRLGWAVVPEPFIDAATRLVQNLFIAAPTHSQQAALAAFGEETALELERRRRAFEARGRFLYHALVNLGFTLGPYPQGAFYLYANCAAFAEDSYRFAVELLERAGVAITPGRDFGLNEAANHVRFAYTTSLENLQEGVNRIAAYLRTVDRA